MAVQTQQRIDWRKQISHFQETATYRISTRESLVFLVTAIITPLLFLIIQRIGRAVIVPADYSLHAERVQIVHNYRVFYGFITAFKGIIVLAGALLLADMMKRSFFREGTYLYYLFMFTFEVMMTLWIPAAARFYVGFAFNVLIGVSAYLTVPALRQSARMFLFLRGWLMLLLVSGLGLTMSSLLNLPFRFLTALLTPGGPNSANETAVQGGLISSDVVRRVFNYLSVLVVAPIVEELAVRRTAIKLFKNQWVGLIASSWLFAFMHVENAGDIEYIFSYLALPLAAGTAYILFKNIHLSMGIHFLNNFLASVRSF